MFGEWLIYAIISLILWGFVNAIDTFFVAEECYHNADEIIVVSSLFKIIGTAVVGGIFYQDMIKVDVINMLVAMGAGALLSFAFWFQIRATFMHNDNSLIHVFWNLSTPLITVLGWVMFEEQLSVTEYIGIGIVTIGAFIISFAKNEMEVDFWSFLYMIIPMIILYSFGEILGKYTEEIGKVDFWGSFPFVCLGQFAFGICLAISKRKSLSITDLWSRTMSGNWKLFLISETTELSALFFMMLAIAATPAIAYYATAEAFLPLIVIAVTAVVRTALNYFDRGFAFQNVFETNHMSGLTRKICATVIMAYGIYLIG